MGHESGLFFIIVGVKQVSVLAPVILKLLLVAVTLVFRHGIFTDDGLSINCLLGGNLFNLHRLCAQFTRSSADADNRLDAFISGQSSPCHK